MKRLSTLVDYRYHFLFGIQAPVSNDYVKLELWKNYAHHVLVLLCKWMHVSSVKGIDK
jgi:succinate dehydrogenase hydrophobic anchor subunit